MDMGGSSGGGNLLERRQKKLRFSQSPIHDWVSVFGLQPWSRASDCWNVCGCVERMLVSMSVSL